ncbi:MAG: sigma-E factor negative regulatory protein [Methylococcaceae bacterium]
MIDEKRAENLSAMLDGALGYTETRKLWKQLESDSELQKQWDRYNRISQLLTQKSGILPDCDFKNRVSAAIASEPTVLAPGAIRNRLKEKVISTALAASLAVAAVIVSKSILNPASLDGRLLVAEVRHEPVPGATTVAEVDPDFQNYLVLHNETAYLAGAQGLLPYARVVSAQPTR